MALINPPQYQGRPFRFDQFMRPEPVQPIQNGKWGPPDMADQLQKGISGILPALAEAYKGTYEQAASEDMRNRMNNDTGNPASAATSLSAPGGPYGPAPVLDAGTPGGPGDPGLKRGYENPTFALIKQEESFTPQAFFDKDHYRAGYSSDTYTDPSTGKSGSVTKGMTVTQDMAEADLRRRVADIETDIRAKIPKYDAMTPGTRAALSSVAYNYGTLPDSVVAAANSGNNPVLAQTVAGLEANPARRRREAALIMSSNASSAPAAAAPQASAGGLTSITENYKTRALQMFPGLQITSEYRSPSANQAAGGVSGSQHLSGRALDVNVSRLNEQQKQALIDDAVQNGAKGIGWYNNNSMHLDFRDTPMAWGPDTHQSSLGQTPPWFQARAAALMAGGGGGPGGATATAAAGPTGGTPYNAAQPVPPQQQPAPAASAAMGMAGQQPPQQQAGPPQAQIPPQQQQRPPTPPVAVQPNLQAAAVQMPPGGPQGAGAPPMPPPRPVQMADASGAVPIPAQAGQPGRTFVIDDNGQRVQIDPATGQPLPAQNPPTPPRPAPTAAVPAQPAPVQTAQAGGVAPIGSTAMQNAPSPAGMTENQRKMLASAIASRRPGAVEGVMTYLTSQGVGAKNTDWSAVSLGDGNVLFYNQRTGQRMVEGTGSPKEQYKTLSDDEVRGLGLDPKTSGVVQQNLKTLELKFPGKQGTNVTVGAGETAEAKTLGEGYGKEQLDLTKAAEGSVGTLGKIAQVRKLLDLSQTGKLAEGITTLGAWGKAAGMSDQTLTDLGFDPKAIYSAQAVQALTGSFLSNMLATGQFPSANFSNADKDFLLSQLPRLGNDPAANKIILDAMEEGSRRSIAKQKMWYAARAKGRSWSQFQEEWFTKLESTPNFFKESGAPGAEFEVDPETGKWRIKR
jgi:GH24 family phage-related lysozyme (muramidase)